MHADDRTKNGFVNLPNKFFLVYFSRILVNIAIGLFSIFILLSLWHSYISALVASLPFIIMSAVPSFLSPITGTQVDRYSKRRIGFISIFLSLLSLLPLFFTADILIVLLIFILLIFFESYFNIDYTVSVRNTVGNENLIYANNLWVASIGISYAVAYILGAYLYMYVSFFAVLLITIFSYFIALILWIFAKVPEVKRGEEKVEYSEIFKVLKDKPSLFHLVLIYDFIFQFVVLTNTPAHIPFCFNLLKMSSFLYGIYSGLSAFLLAVVPLSIHRFLKPEKIKKYAVSSILYEGILTILIASIPIILTIHAYQIMIFLTLIIIMTFPSTLEMDSFTTIFQKAVPIKILGRFSSVRSLFRGTISISSILLAGYLTDIFGPIIILMFSGAFLLILVIPTKCVLKGVNV